MTNEIYVPDSLLPSDNVFDVPCLRIDMQATSCEIPFVLFGEQKRTYQMNGCGTLHFYTDDYRYGEALFQNPDKILRHNPANIVEPNYSLFNETPVSFGLQQIYKKRFIARALQEKGIKVFVDLNVSSKYYKLNLLGVPKGYGAFCTRGYSDRLQYLAFEYELAKMIAGDTPLLFVVYGGGEKVRQFCRQNHLIYTTPVVTMKKKAKQIERMKETIAFFGQEIKPQELLPSFSRLPTEEKLRAEQIDDFRQMIK